ncbi:vascular endothelial growth factor receptor 1-like [Amblyomma americanum]
MARRTVWLEPRFWWECAAFYCLLLCWMYVGPTLGVSRYLPPMLDINGFYIDIAANSTLRITCYGRYPLAWALPPFGDNVSLRSSVIEEQLDGVRSFKSVFELNTTDVMDLGRYTCYYNGTIDLTNTGNATSVYVFVNANPEVAVVNDTELFAYGANFTLVCTVKGSQPLHAWWEWRECAEPRACDKQSPSGVFSKLWPDSLHHKNSPGDGTPLMHSAEGRGHLNVTLRLRAKQSGLYQCVGLNWEGKDRSIAKFYVTDAKNGLEIIASDVRPLDQDQVWLSCLANQFKYENLTWRWKARGSPDYLTLHSGDGLEIKVSSTPFSNNLTLYFNTIERYQSGNYECIGSIRGGNRDIRSVNITVRGVPAQGMNSTQIAWISVGISVFVICILVTLFFFCKKYRAVMKEKEEMESLNKTLFDKSQVDMFNPDLPLCEQVELLPYDQRWEFPRDRLKLGRTLGQGAFGRVVKAEAIGLGPSGQPLTVAVKMLKERADMSQRKALMAELKILIHLGRHLNIVNILGAVTKNAAKGGLMVIVDYCKFGNLRHYLLSHRQHFINQLNPETGKVDPDICHSPKSPTSASPGFRQQRQQHTPTLNDADLAMSATSSSRGNDFCSPVSKTGSSTDGFLPESGNHAPLMSGSSLRDRGNLSDAALTTCDLLCFAFQCARGMEYLASRKLIHRDLAARNVLLSEENVVKICDFGLAKDCYKYSNYVKKGDGLLPVKWTAIESIMDRVFTTKSDVWSYGVLLWEMFSLGGNPYPGVVIDESFYKRLKNDYRMEKPDYAPDDVYEIMQSCWQAEPTERPDFSALVTRLGDLLQAGV